MITQEMIDVLPRNVIVKIVGDSRRHVCGRPKLIVNTIFNPVHSPRERILIHTHSGEAQCDAK